MGIVISLYEYMNSLCIERKWNKRINHKNYTHIHVLLSGSFKQNKEKYYT